MSVYQWLCVLGIPGLIAGLVTFIKIQIATNKAIKLGVQAILRDRLFPSNNIYKFCVDIISFDVYNEYNSI